VSELGIISLLVFVSALLGVQAAYWLISRARRTHASVNRRLASSARLADPSETLNALRRERGLLAFHIPGLGHLHALMAQSGMKLDPNVLLPVLFCGAALLYFVSGLFIGYGATAVLAAMASTLALTYLFFRAARQRRIARFAEQLPDAIDVLVRGVRAGYPLPVALGLVAREMPDPIGIEFGLTAEEIAFGQSTKTAIENMYRRVGQEDLQFVVVAINVQVQTGGNLAEILSRLARLVRQRSKLHLKVRALSAEGRIAAKFLSLMPFLLFGVVSVVSPAYFAEVRGHPLIGPALIYAALSLLVGNLMMYRMVNFKI